MYDLKNGSDTGREWVEIFNSASETIDISNWRLYEGGTNHNINLVNETDSFIIPSDSYALLVDNVSKFLIDWYAVNYFQGGVLSSKGPSPGLSSYLVNNKVFDQKQTQ